MWQSEKHKAQENAPADMKALRQSQLWMKEQTFNDNSNVLHKT